MRLIDYLSHSGLDENTNKFRVLNIKLVKEDTSYDDVISYVAEKYNIKMPTNDLIDRLNDRLKIIYKGKYKFDFVIDEGKQIDEIIPHKKSKRLKLYLFEAENLLSVIKTELEKKAGEI